MSKNILKDDSAYWYPAFRIPFHKTIRSSLHTTQEEEAVAVAIAMIKYYDLEQRLKRGLTIRPRPLSITSQRVRYLYQCSPDRSYNL